MGFRVPGFKFAAAYLADGLWQRGQGGNVGINFGCTAKNFYIHQINLLHNLYQFDLLLCGLRLLVEITA